MPTYRIQNGDCRNELKSLADCSVDSIVTDPPYGIGFMGKEWDTPGSFVERKPAKENRFDHVGGNHNPVNSADSARTRRVEGHKFQLWCETWAVECLRVLKPGGHLLAFGGSRTYHRLACAIEDAGFEIRDQIQWIYGSGFPKSLNIGNGWGTALKPAHEPIVLARKPLVGTVAANVVEYGTGGLNVDGCRIGTTKEVPWGSLPTDRSGHGIFGAFSAYKEKGDGQDPNVGRWPANVIHDGSDEVLSGFPDSDHARGNNGASKGGGGMYGHGECINTFGSGDIGSAARFFYCAKASKEDRDEGLELLAPRDTRDTVNRDPESAGVQSPRAGAGRGAGAPIYLCTSCGLNLNSGGRIASNCPVSGEHVRGLSGYGQPSRNHHPTVKPTDLMRYLCRLVTPPNGIVLDPFTGSGSTGKAAILEGLNFIGIELSAEYCELANRRIDAVTRQGNLLFDGESSPEMSLMA